jgi:hypothetical protein
MKMAKAAFGKMLEILQQFKWYSPRTQNHKVNRNKYKEILFLFVLFRD